MESDFLVDDFASVLPGVAFRLFPFGRIVKGGKVREVTKELAAKFRLPHWRPAIKLGGHADDAPAGGFITGLEVRDDGLYALTEWNEQGAAAMAEGKFRYHSPEVAWAGGFEDPTTGIVSDAPTIVGDALLHTPHLGEATALYSVEQVIDTNGGNSMTEETIPVAAGLLDRLIARLDRPDPKPDPVAPIEPQGEDFVAKYEAEAEQVEILKAQIAKSEAQAAVAERVTHFASELPDEAESMHIMLANMDEDQAKDFAVRIKALTEQAKASGLTEDVGASGESEGAGDPVAAFDAAIKAKMADKALTYPAAVDAVITESPDLFAAYQAGGN